MYRTVDGGRTISAWLNRSFNIANALDSHPVLVIAINELVFKFANLINKNTQFIRNIRDIIIAGFAPNGKLLLSPVSIPQDARQHIRSYDVLQLPFSPFQPIPYCASHFSPSSPTARASSRGPDRMRRQIACGMHDLIYVENWVRNEDSRRCACCGRTKTKGIGAIHAVQERRGVPKENSPKLLLPNILPVLVVEVGGGGFSNCDAVGARDWRMEYVRCMVGFRLSLLIV